MMTLIFFHTPSVPKTVLIYENHPTILNDRVLKMTMK